MLARRIANYRAGRIEGRGARCLCRTLLAIVLLSALGEVAALPAFALTTEVPHAHKLFRAADAKLTIHNVAAQQVVPPAEPQSRSLVVIVLDENGVAVSSASLVLTQEQTVFRGETNYAGRYEFTRLPAGVYQLQVEKEGFFALVHREVRVGETESVEVTLNHQREFVERVNVTYSPPRSGSAAWS